MQASSLLRGTAFLTVTGIFSQLLGFFYRIVLSRLIGAENMGIFQLIMPVYALLLSVSSVGLTSSVSTLAAHRLALGDRPGVKSLVNHCISWFLLLGSGAGILLALGSDWISVWCLGDARTQLGLILLVPCFLLTGVENLQKYYFYGIGHIKAPALIELAEQLIRTAAVLGLLICFLPQNPERTIGLILCGMVVCEIFSALTLTVLFQRTMIGIRTYHEEGLLTSVLSVALPVGGTALLNNLLHTADSLLIPRLLVAGGMDVSQAMCSYGTLFGMTAPLLCLPTALIGAMGLVLVPDLARSTALGKSSHAARQVEHCLSSASLFLFPSLAFLAATGQELGQALFREGAAGTFLIPLAIGTALNCHQAILSNTLNGIGLQKASARTALLCGVLQLVCTLATVKQWGLEGYLAGYLISSVLGVEWNRRAVHKVLGLPAKVYTAMIPPAVGSLLMGVCVYALFYELLGRGLPLFPAVGICFLFGLVLYLAALQAQGRLQTQKKRKG